MTINRIRLTEARWRRLAPELRAMLRQVLGGKPAIINRPVLDIARALCARGAYDLALAFYKGLDGQPPADYQGCGFRLMMSLKARMGKHGPDPTRTILV